jgi:hypothetical protein
MLLRVQYYGKFNDDGSLTVWNCSIFCICMSCKRRYDSILHCSMLLHITYWKTSLQQAHVQHNLSEVSPPTIFFTLHHTTCFDRYGHHHYQVFTIIVWKKFLCFRFDAWAFFTRMRSRLRASVSNSDGSFVANTYNTTRYVARPRQMSLTIAADMAMKFFMFPKNQC